MNNFLTVSAETEVSQVIVSGVGNGIKLCNGEFDFPEVIKSGVNNWVKPVDCLNKVA